MMMASSLCTTAAPHRGSGLRSSFLASIPPAIGGRTGASHGCSLLVVRAMIEPSEKSVEVMRKFSEQYARRSGTYFCADKGVTAVVIKSSSESLKLEKYMKNQGLADHKDSVGAPLCPCRHYDNKEAEVGQGFWNCPCVPMRERKECHCMLFLTPDNDFAGTEQTISLEEIRETTSKF